jgi:Ca-activated chloride channel homolog
MKSSRTTIARFAAVTAVAFTLLAGGLFFVTRHDSPAARLLRQGNQAFEKGSFIDALGIYQLAQNRFPELAEPFYNAANALYRQESYPDAIAQLDQALQTAVSDQVAQSSHYNKGNAAYNSQDLAAAIQAYIAALLINPADADAKYNLELALQQQQQQEQQEQEQEENQEQQEQEQSQDGEGQDSENQDQPSEDGSQEQQEQSQDGQSQAQDQGENGDQQTDQPSEQNQGEQGEQSPDQQPQPGQGQPQEGQPSDQQPNSMVPQPGERLTAEQARQLLAAIAQGSGTLQERLQQMYVVPRPPSGQDW